ncbi:hypothetical protein SESBI_50696 [Sesbania bispinosa]|nr:hypothetical protein SESBI_50696 [Sesbania bispinosa]
MDSQGTSERSEPIPKAFINGNLVGMDNINYVPEPEEDSERLPIWRNQSLIPFSIQNKDYCFLGPYFRPTRLNRYTSFFPCPPEEKLLAFQDPIRTDFLNNLPSIFRTVPHVKKQAYLDWLDRVESSKGSHWKKLGIFYLIQLSRYEL